jgi:hypothetical protein
MRNLKRLFLLFMVFSPLSSMAQDFFTEGSEPVNAFRAPILINAQTTVMSATGGFDFYIRHRFGFFEMDNSIVKQFFGMDGVANIRFSFIFPVTKGFSVGAARSKNGKLYDLEIKKLIVSQKTDNSTPFSLAAYFNSAINSDAEPVIQPYSFFADGTTPFKNKFNHRLSYNSQLILSRQFCNKLSFQLAGVYTYRNLVPVGDENHTFVLPVSGAIKTSLNSSILFEYAYRFNNRPAHGIYPASVAFEFGTVSHVFQIVVTSSKEFEEQLVYAGECTDYRKGNIGLGFNMKRTFWFKHKKKQ